jgi:hypothetical protein
LRYRYAGLPVTYKPWGYVRSKRSIYIAALIAFSSVTASAQDGNFQGLFLGINGSLSSTNTDLNFDGLSIKSVGQVSTSAVAQIGYGYAATESAVFSFGVTYRLSDLRAGEASFDEGSYEFYAKRNYGIYFEPGYRIGGKTLMYGLVSYENAKGVDEFVALNPAESDKARRNVKGFGFGFGSRSFFNDIGYIQIQIKKINFDQENVIGSTAVFEPSNLEGSIGIGFRY